MIEPGAQAKPGRAEECARDLASQADRRSPPGDTPSGYADAPCRAHRKFPRFKMLPAQPPTSEPVLRRYSFTCGNRRKGGQQQGCEPGAHHSPASTYRATRPIRNGTMKPITAMVAAGHRHNPGSSAPGQGPPELRTLEADGGDFGRLRPCRLLLQIGTGSQTDFLVKYSTIDRKYSRRSGATLNTRLTLRGKNRLCG